MKYKKILYLSFLFVLCLLVLYIKFSDAKSAEELVKDTLNYGTVVLPVFFVPFYLCIWQEDFSSRFVNNILISGISRIKYYIAKLAIMYLTGTIFVVGYSIVTFILCSMTEGKFSLEKMLSVAVVQMLLYMVVLTVGLMIYILVNSVALSTAVYVLFVLLFENILNSLFIQLDINSQKIAQYFLFQNLSKAVNIYEISMAEKYSVLIGGSVVWGVAFAISILVLKNREYK